MQNMNNSQSQISKSSSQSSILTQSTFTGADEEESLDLVAYWRLIQRRKWGILGLAVFLTLLVGVVVFMMTPIYSSTVTLLIEQEKAKILSIDEVYSGVSSGQQHYQTQVELLESNSLMEAVVDRLKLTKHPLFDPSQRHSFIKDLLASFGSGTKVYSEAELRKGVVAALAASVQVEGTKKSQLVKVTVSSSDRELAALIANTIADVYIEIDLDARYKRTQKATDWMNSHLSTLKAKLEESERALQTYREQHNLIDTKDLALSGAASQLETMMTRLVEARSLRAQAKNNLDQVSRAKGNELSMPIVQRNPLVANLMQTVSEQERKVSELSNRYGAQHPKLIQANAELNQAKRNLNNQVHDVVNGLNQEYEVARANESALAGAVAEAKQGIQGTNRKEFELTTLEREVKSNRDLYDMFMGRLKETSTASDLQSVVARVVDPAIVSDVPVKPKKRMIVTLAFVLSLMLGIVVAFLIEHLDNSVRSAEDAERKLGLPLLAAAPMIELAAGQSAGLHYRDAPKSLFSESIKTVRTGILLSGIDHVKKTLVVTSSVPGEGKSTIAINLALAHAQTKKVLLIDADMRRPSVAKVLGLDNTHPGLSMLVLGMVKLEECVYKIEGSTLDVLTAGSIPPNPLELLLSDKFHELIAKLGEVYDTIIIDSPPVQLVSDAVVLANMATGLVFVLKADATPFQLARRAIYTLQRGGANIFGVVLNQANFKNEEYYGGYGGYGRYNYHAYYGEDAEKADKAAGKAT